MAWRMEPPSPATFRTVSSAIPDRSARSSSAAVTNVAAKAAVCGSARNCPSCAGETPCCSMKNVGAHCVRVYSVALAAMCERMIAFAAPTLKRYHGMPRPDFLAWPLTPASSRAISGSFMWGGPRHSCGVLAAKAHHSAVKTAVAPA